MKINQKKIIKITHNILDYMERIFFLIVFFIGVYFIYDTAYVFYYNSADRVLGYKPDAINAETLLNLSEDCVAWITLDDSEIDYPIMQSDDNIKYLNTDPEGNYALAGSIFLDFRNSPDFSDKYSLVYGHNMEGKKMFGPLINWAKKDYFDEHLTGTLTAGDIEYEFNIFAYVETDTSEEIVFNPIGNYPIDYIKKNAKNYVEPKEGNLVVLSTCKSPTSTKRNILCGTIVEKGKQ